MIVFRYIKQIFLNIEHQLFQDLLYRCLVAPRSLSAPLLRCLGALFAKKANSIPTDAMLTRLLEPILWRHLKVVLFLNSF